jgi:hypothetical protein
MSTLHEDFSYLRKYLAEAVEKIKTQILCSIIFFPKILPFMR